MTDSSRQNIAWDDDDDSTYDLAEPASSEVGIFQSEDISTSASEPQLAFTKEGDGGEVYTITQIDPQTGEEVSQTIDFATPELNADEAKALTERIKSTTNVLWMLIKRAHAGKAYSALGYSSFESYVNAEFSMSRSYAYRLLNQANVIEAIESKAPDGTQVYIGDATARGLKKVLPEILSDVEERTAGLGPVEAGQMIEEVIRDHKEKQRDRLAEEDEDFGGNSGGYEDDDTIAYGAGGPYREFDEAEDDDDEDSDGDLTGFLNEDPAEQRRKFDKLYNLYAGLKSIQSVGDGSELPEFVPEDRIAEFDGLIENVTVWLDEFRTLWREHQGSRSNEETTDSESDDDEEYEF